MKEQIEKLTAELIRVDSTKGKSINAATILHQFLDEQGYDATLDEYSMGEGNVYCDIGPSNSPAFLISGHLDTVPIGDPQNWTHHPYSAKIIDGEMWGRGSVDMKGGTASLAGVMVELLEHEDDLQQRVLFAATGEEETGLVGAQAYVRKGLINNISHVLIAEPTDLQPNSMEKGIMWLKVKATGKQAHASRPDLGHNAIEGLATIFPDLHASLPSTTVEGLGPSSLNVGLIHGGSAANVIAETAEATLDIRTTPGVENQQVIDGINKVLELKSNGVQYNMEVLESVSAIQSPNNTLAEYLADRTAHHYGTHYDIGGVHYATDGAIFMEHLNHEVPFIIYGPGSTELLHQTNERLDLQQLDIARKVTLEGILNVAT